MKATRTGHGIGGWSVIILVMLVIGSAAGGVGGSAAAQPERPDSSSHLPSWVDTDEYHLLWRDDGRTYGNRVQQPPSRSSLHPEQMSGYDVQLYDLDITLVPDSSLVRGAVTISAVSLEDSLAVLRLDLAVLQATAASSQGMGVPFVQDAEGLSIDLPSGIALGDTIEVTIEYGGVPEKGLMFDTDDGVYHTMAEPSDAHYWFPCKDIPSDKAALRMSVTVPEGLIVASNGLLVEETHQGVPPLATFVWEEDHPIATYLISLAVADYFTFQDSFVKPVSGDTIDVIYYAYPTHDSAAIYDFANTVDMMEYYSSVFGEYPFSKYGMAMAPILGGHGAMEHQTCTTMGDRLVTGTRTYEWVVAHELAHQWWGDLVTLYDWRHIWLNEGFAVYCDALYTGHAYGESAFRSRMESFARMYFTYDRIHRYSIYDPEILLSPVTYEKAAWVLHMLRYVVGEEQFWEILPLYAERFAYGNASTDDFQQLCEEVSGLDLTWFFDQWIYEAGHPILEVSWQTDAWGRDGAHEITGSVLQLQEQAPYFRIPLEIGVTGQAGQDTTVLVQVSASDPATYFSLTIPWAPSTLTIDPNGWVLHQPASWLRSKAQLTVFPNPMRLSADSRCYLSFQLDSPLPVGLDVFDVMGRRVKTLTEGGTPWPAGYHLSFWDGRDGDGNEVGSGTYFIHLTTGSRQETRKVLLVR